MIESRLLRDLREQRAAEDEIDDFVDVLLLVLEEVPEVRQAIAAITASKPAAFSPPPRTATTSPADRKRKGARRG